MCERRKRSTSRGRGTRKGYSDQGIVSRETLLLRGSKLLKKSVNFPCECSCHLSPLTSSIDAKERTTKALRVLLDGERGTGRCKIDKSLVLLIHIAALAKAASPSHPFTLLDPLEPQFSWNGEKNTAVDQIGEFLTIRPGN